MTMKLVVETDGAIDLADELEEEFRPRARRVMQTASAIVLARIQSLLRTRQGTRYTAAPAGAAPERDSGELARSFRTLGVRVQGRIVEGGIWSDHPGANRLEFGLVDVRGIRTFPHPYVAPVMRGAEDVVTDLFRKELG